MSNNNSGPKNSKIIPLFITFAILFVVVFGLGVIIGKGLGGSDTNTVVTSYDDEAPIVEYGVPDMDTEESEVSEFESDEVILDKDDETLVEEKDPQEVSEVIDNTESQKKESTEAVTPTKAPEPKEVIEEKETAEIVIEKPKPVEKKSPKDSGAMPKIDPNGRYTVQIGAFQNQTEANKLVSSLKSNGYPAFIKQVQTPDKKNWYRVRVGTFSTRSDAVSYGNKLKQSETKVKSVFITVNN
ncbi:MAG: hypothetical protein DHS20C13_25480 [Thermodesulfobacteriota bacterium]|nr:MAG: hypothetical protein DHS20C13_25480 [Thermodesulfobacteriota bacterium]